MSSFRLVATDLDGTLLRSDASVSDRTRGAIRAVAEAGVHVTLVTARAPRWVPQVVERLGLDAGFAVCSNGAIVYDFARDAAFLHHTLPADIATRIVEAMRAAAPGVAFACERESVAFREPHYVPLWPTPGMEDSRGDALELVAKPVSKLVVQHPRLSQDELFALVAGVCGEDATATISGDVLVEISAAGVTKAYALAALCTEIGVGSDEVLAFGDMPNDIPMLEWAGHGVAVENAHPDVIAVADEVTAANDEDGVAIALERILLGFDAQPHLLGELVELRPLRESDYAALATAAADPLIWEQHPAPLRYRDDVFRAFFAEHLASGGALLALDRATGEVIGTTRFNGFDPQAGEVEIGWTFLVRSRWGGAYNGEMKALMLAHAFRFVRSVIFLVDPRNVRSQRAVEKIGAVRIGSRPDASGRESIAYRIRARART